MLSSWGEIGWGNDIGCAHAVQKARDLLRQSSATLWGGVGDGVGGERNNVHVDLHMQLILR